MSFVCSENNGVISGIFAYCQRYISCFVHGILNFLSSTPYVIQLCYVKRDMFRLTVTKIKKPNLNPVFSVFAVA